jgi:large subunit ribosomal protein L10
MAQTKEQKQKVIDDLKEKIEKQKSMVFVDFTGLKVKDFSILRKKMKAVGNELKVAKKTLLGVVFKKAGLEVEFKKIKGEIAVIFGLKDEFSPAKLSWQFAEANQNLKILGGYFEKKIRTAEEITALAQLPSKEELLARLVGSIKAPVSGFVGVLNGNLRNLVYILSQIKVTQ